MRDVLLLPIDLHMRVDMKATKAMRVMKIMIAVIAVITDRNFESWRGKVFFVF